ncbi:MAG: hypothetical protein O9346_17775 [Leptospiraceae bacterium]|nr:hypothetical protein [Leptospiraceae bacterium]MCZ8348265.1 hypothetical protein [Leptospiraceae bacterium]
MSFRNKKGSLFSSAFLCIGLFHSIFSQNQDFDSLYQEYKSGNYSHVARQSKLIIQKDSSTERDLRFLVLYISTENKIEEMDKMLETVYQSSDKRTAHLTNAMYLILERALVANTQAIGEKWGYRFRQEAETSSRYADGLYYYASLLFQNQKEKDAFFVSNLALNANPNANLRNQILTLQSAINKIQANKK